MKLRENASPIATLEERRENAITWGRKWERKFEFCVSCPRSSIAIVSSRSFRSFQPRLKKKLALSSKKTKQTKQKTTSPASAHLTPRAAAKHRSLKERKERRQAREEGTGSATSSPSSSAALLLLPRRRRRPRALPRPLSATPRGPASPPRRGGAPRASPTAPLVTPPGRARRASRAARGASRGTLLSVPLSFLEEGKGAAAEVLVPRRPGRARASPARRCGAPTEPAPTGKGARLARRG